MIQTNIYIGDVIKEVMAEKRITKAELARRLGIRPQSVEYLLKRKSIDTDTLYNVSLALGYDFSVLYAIRKPQTNLDKDEIEKKISKAKMVVEFELDSADLAKLNLKHKFRKYIEEE